MGFHGSIYQSFIALESQEEEIFQKHISHAKLKIVDSVQTESNSTKSLYGILSRCFTLSLLETAGKCSLRYGCALFYKQHLNFLKEDFYSIFVICQNVNTI